MRAYLYLPVLLLTGLSADAQPTIFAADRLPIIGTARTLLTKNLTDDPPPGGADVTWDYTWLTGPVPVPVEYVDPATTLMGASFPEATLAIVIPSAGDQARYLSVTGEGLLEHGTYTPPPPLACTNVWSNTKILLPPQLSFGGEGIDDYAGQCDEVPVSEEGTYECFADGWGTLIMPNNTWSNVLRVVTERYSTLSGLEWHETLLDYYSPGLPEAVLNTSRLFLMSNGSETQFSYAANFIDEIGLGFAEDDAGGLGLFPNPAHDDVRITLPRAMDTASRLELIDAVGRPVRTVFLAGAVSTVRPIVLVLSGLVAGCYQVILTDASGRRTGARLIKD